MALSDDERRAWEELERDLTTELPTDLTDLTDLDMTAAGEPPAAGTLPPSARHTLILLIIMGLGTWLLLTGALTFLLPMAITGLIIVCLAAHHLHRPRYQGPEDRA